MKKRTLKRRKGLNPLILILFIILSLTIYSIIFIDSRVGPIVEALSEAEARIIGAQGISRGVTQALENGIRYDDLINITKDNNGNISLIQADTVAMNLLGSDITTFIQDHMDVYENDIKRIPLGNILGSKLFANHGPKFKVYIIPIGSITLDFYTEFLEGGINQTIHRIYIEVDAKLQVIVPLSNKIVEITSDVPIAETVIVGDVPKTYINVPSINMKDKNPSGIYDNIN